MARFTVDTHLFRELGELLVGRDSTAPVELIKNAYDADATRVTVYGERLDSPEHGRIVLVDNGTGMGISGFERGFLRIASRMKDGRERRSRDFGRRYTGAKGIGRLAAHKLAKVLEVQSLAASRTGEPRRELHATIDWDAVERCETLDEIDSTDAIVIGTRRVPAGAMPGTTLTLRRLRRAWSGTERARFFAEVESFAPPTFLSEPIPRSVVDSPLLFDMPIVRDTATVSGKQTESFGVHLEGELAAGEDYWGPVAEAANWVLEARSSEQTGMVRYAIAPTVHTLTDDAAAVRLEQSIPHPDPKHGPHFDARILIREGSLPRVRPAMRTWAARTSGIRAYLEGFRVLPYGEQGDDWLSIDADYARRPRRLELLRELDPESDDSVDEDAGLSRLRNNSYFGAIFLTRDHCPNLRVLVNREGFIPDLYFDTLVRFIRVGIDLSTRARAAASYQRRQERREVRRNRPGAARPVKVADRRVTDLDVEESYEGPTLPMRLREAASHITEAQARLGEGDTDRAAAATSAAAEQLERATELAEDIWSARSLLHVLASVGTQMTAFVHEIHSLLGVARTVENALSQLAAQKTLAKDLRTTLRRLVLAAGDLTRGLERQAAYLVEIDTPDARRRRSRQRMRERFDAAVQLVEQAAARRGIVIENNIPPDLRSPPLFRAELAAVFANVLTNAIKAAGEDGRVLASAHREKLAVRVRIENTGVAVSLEESERWFQPFESTTTEVDATLGQGMGLGLTITRNLLETYGASINFVEPSHGFATALVIHFPTES